MLRQGRSRRRMARGYDSVTSLQAGDFGTVQRRVGAVGDLNAILNEVWHSGLVLVVEIVNCRTAETPRGRLFPATHCSSRRESTQRRHDISDYRRGRHRRTRAAHLGTRYGPRRVSTANG